jgi:hypothetical protein
MKIVFRIACSFIKFLFEVQVLSIINSKGYNGKSAVCLKRLEKFR